VDCGLPRAPGVVLDAGLEDGEGFGVSLFPFARSRSVLELGGIGTVARGAEAVACDAALSKGPKIARVRSSHGSIEPCAGSDGRPPLRFLVAASSFGKHASKPQLRERE